MTGSLLYSVLVTEMFNKYLRNAEEIMSAMKFWCYCSPPFRISSITYLGIGWRVLFWANPAHHCMISASFPDQMVLVPHLGNISPELHSRRHCLSRWSGCVGTNQWPTPFKIHNRKPSIFVAFPWSPFRYHQSLFETGGHLLRKFLLNEWKQRRWFLSDIRLYGS